MEKFIMAGDAAIRYTDTRRGVPTILLLHGYLEALEVWDDFAGELGKHFRVLRLDLPGHGLSQWGGREVISMDYMAEKVAAVLEDASVERCTVVGHSMGGYVALALAAAYPQRLEGLVLFHSSPNADTLGKATHRQREIELVEAGKKEMLARLNPGRGFADANLKRCSEVIEELAEQVMMTEDEAVVAILKGMAARLDYNAMMHALPVPQLMIFGRADHHIPVSAAEQMIQAQPQARVAWLEHSGHMGFVEQPKESVDILKSFLSDLS